MRISGGDARGIRLKVPKGIRPTSEKVRQAIFSSLARRVLDARVLDLYCGSGAYGIEALSRGADHAVFVDRDVTMCRENVRAAGFAADATIKRSEVGRYLANAAEGRFDLVFVDPPYADALTGLFDRLSALLAPDGQVIYESRWKRVPTPEPQGWVVEADRRYGDTRVLMLSPGAGR